MKLETIEVRLADDRGLGSLSFNGRFTDGRQIKVDYHFPENNDLFSPGGDYDLEVSVNGGSSKLSEETDEEFREALPSRARDLSLKRVQKAAEILGRALYP